MEHIKKTIVIFLLFLAYTSNAQEFKDPRRTFSYDKDDTTIMPGDVRTHMIFFEYNGGHHFYPEFSDSLDLIVKFLILNKNVKVLITTNMDFRGTSETNLKISEIRAKRIEEYLKSKNVPEEKYTIVGRGEENPLISESTIYAEPNEEIREKYHRINRRVEVKIISTSLK